MDIWIFALIQAALIVWLLYRLYVTETELEIYAERLEELSTGVMIMEQDIQQLRDWQDKKDMQELAANLGLENAAAGTD